MSRPTSFGCPTLYYTTSGVVNPIISAEGNYEITTATKAIVFHDGLVVWEPPAIYKSSCPINVQHFPLDHQECFLKFGSWTYNGDEVDLQHISAENNEMIVNGINLNKFYQNIQWEVLSVPAKRYENYFSCCPEPYPWILFKLNLRRKTMFYTINMIIPCVSISFLTALVFYLPSDSGEKITLSVSILLSLTVFILQFTEIIPPTSIVVPLIGKYVLFTMFLVTLSVVMTIAVLNLNFRSPSTHNISLWARKFFLEFLPPYLFMNKPHFDSCHKSPVQNDRLSKIISQERKNDGNDSGLHRGSRYVNSIANWFRDRDAHAQVG
ncbi:acetylcholine receptor subunit alpha-like 1 [Octopus sinensis]|uniref:Acetylcholine receptor subunit alpha-like 1 n=1 Tax=Octopus sinensis TaxID=2607531 RepID=A0A6P7TYI3_9MOLL|nr:acetylcholine receptor subunit alpha-like 1 [Octopus sinensis]